MGLIDFSTSLNFDDKLWSRGERFAQSFHLLPALTGQPARNTIWQNHCSDAPFWWVLIDYLFLVISFYAIFSISKNLTVKWLKSSFWISWLVLLITIANHSINIINLPNNFIYIPSIVIVVLHFYNLKYCKCQDEKCCTSVWRIYRFSKIYKINL